MRFITFEELCSTIRSYVDRKAMLTFHSIGDRDAVGSAVALSECMHNAEVRTPDFLTNNAKRMLEFVGYDKKIEPEFSNCEAVIVLDANNTGVLGKFKGPLSTFPGTILFIDHHVNPSPKEKVHATALAFNDESYNSTASIVYELMTALGVKISKKAATLLLNGITADSADLQNANAKTFKQMAELVEISGVNYADLTEYYHASVPAQSRFLTINDIQKSKTEQIGRYVLVYGRATAHANVDADSAINLGADAAVYWAITEKEASISARLRPPLDRLLNLNLGEIMKSIGERVEGTGGGHACAAGAYGPRKDHSEEAAMVAVQYLRDAFKR